MSGESTGCHLALEGPVQVLDGGNFFDAYTIARQVRRLLEGASLAVEGDRISAIGEAAELEALRRRLESEDIQTLAVRAVEGP